MIGLRWLRRQRNVRRYSARKTYQFISCVASAHLDADGTFSWHCQTCNYGQASIASRAAMLDHVRQHINHRLYNMERRARLIPKVKDEPTEAEREVIKRYGRKLTYAEERELDDNG